RRRGAGPPDAYHRRRRLAVRPGQRPERPRRQPARHDQHPAGHQGRRGPAGRHRGDVSMSDLAVSPALPQPAPSAPVATARMRETGEAFEASFLAQMLKPIFEGLSTDGPFGGGEAESTWRSFMIE